MEEGNFLFAIVDLVRSRLFLMLSFEDVAHLCTSYPKEFSLSFLSQFDLDSWIESRGKRGGALIQYTINQPST